MVPSPPLAEGIYEPSPGDVVRLSGLSDAKYDDKIARIISKVTNGDRVPVRILPNGPEIRILRIRATFPAICRMCGDRISDITCGTCFAPSEFRRPSELSVDADVCRSFDATLSANPTGTLSQPSSCDSASRVLSSPARGTPSTAKERTSTSRPSEAEIARRIATAVWTD